MTKGLESMSKEEGHTIIKEIMGAYDKYRKLWIKRFGSAEGFDDWFRIQTTKDR